MSGQIPELPPSMGATFAILAGLALALSPTGKAVMGAREAARASDEVRTKARRLYSELERLQAEHNDTLSWLRSSAPATPASIAGQVEEMGERIQRFFTALRRVEQGADQLERALAGAAPHAHSLERMHRGWREAVAKAHGVLAKFRSDVSDSEFLRQVDPNNPMFKEMLLRSLAEQGLQEWTANLPAEEGPMFDASDEQPVHWDSAVGWVEGVS
jgi:hypothetical protein